MLFTHEYEHTIDAKQRLAIPADIRARMDPERDGNAFYLVWGPNGSLWLWPERTFEEMAAALGQTLVPDEEMMEFEEALFSRAARLEIDKAGRIRLPERMLKEASLESQVVIIGVKDHLELRDPEAWEAGRKQKLERHPEIMLRARRALNEQRRLRGDR